MKKQIATGFALAALVVLGACGASPTEGGAAAPGRVHANEMVAPASAPQSQPRDTTTQRVPNMMGSGN